LFGQKGDSDLLACYGGGGAFVGSNAGGAAGRSGVGVFEGLSGVFGVPVTLMWLVVDC
jgi:hypothetical protein